jgi:hypothetical protein
VEAPRAEINNNKAGLKVGDRVTFEMFWWGETRQFTGTILSFVSEQAAMVRYDIPTEFLHKNRNIPEVQLPVATFAKAKVAEVPIQPTGGTPLDAAGNVLQVGDRVCGKWSAGQGYVGVIKSFSGRTKIKAHGTWIEGRRACDSDQFSVAVDSLVKKTTGGTPHPVDRLTSTQPEEMPPVGSSQEETIAYLTGEIKRLQQEGYVPPSGSWIEVYTANEGTSRHVRYNARVPCFTNKKTGGLARKQSIGKFNSPEHQKATESIARRRQIESLKKQIKELQK